MERNLNTSITLVFGHEGGYVNHPKDPGGPTKYGITQRTLKAWRGKPVSIADVKALTLDEASRILKAQYWGPVRGDALPSGLDHAMFDFAVNSGPAQAAKILQRILGVAADGVIGARTLQAVAAKNIASLLDTLKAERMVFLKSLKNWKTFGDGWGKRVKRVTQEAKTLAAQKKPVCATALCGLEQANPSDIKVMATDQGKSIAGAGIGAIGIAATQLADTLAPHTEAPFIKYAFMALTMVGVGIGAYIAIRSIMSGKAAETAT